MISVCIPVYNTEDLIERCIKSVLAQTYTDYEIIVLNDGSPGKDKQGRNCKKIIKSIQKEIRKQKKNISITYLEHNKNKGLMQVRRDMLAYASGEWIYMLDSDDTLPPNAFQVLLETAVAQNAEIVQADCTTVDSNGDYVFNRRGGKVYNGRLEKREILDTWLCHGGYTCYLWGKLTKKELYDKAFEQLPLVYCTMKEDIAIWFFICLNASSYVGIPDKLYNYTVDTGITSKRMISSLEKWEQVCSTSSVFTLLLTLVTEDDSFSEEEKIAVSRITKISVHDNIMQLEKAVVPELQDTARKMLYEYWGEDFVKRFEGKENPWDAN